MQLSQEPDSKLPWKRFSFPGTAAVLLALLAPALGGGTSPAAMAALLAGIGLVAVALPAKGVRPGFLFGAGLLLAVTLGWLWPASLNQLGWRAPLEEAGFSLGWCGSPEPWVSLRAWLVLLGGLVWAGWCAGQMWTTRERRGVCEGLAVGIGAIALVALATRNGHVPGWPKGTGLGPFANRNQTAALFAMGAFLTAGCGTERFRRWRGSGRSFLLLMGLGAAWLCLLVVYTAALALDMSRAGPLLFAGMTVAWGWAVLPPGKRKIETVAAAVAVALLLATVFLLTGRGIITRLATSRVADFRLKIFSDTIGMIRASPWTGTGLGCFDVIFPLYRKASILQERVLHPESDWLWLGAETGLTGLLAMAGLAGWMGSRAWRGFAVAEDRAMRLAVVVACLGMLAHSFVDVPGHRLGTLMPAVLLLGLAVGAEDAEERWAGVILRLFGLVVLLLGAVASAFPAALSNAAGIPMGQQAEATLNEALKWRPLDWRLYMERAEIEGARGAWTAALGDFRRARFLEPNNAGVPFDEGIYWLAVAPRFAIEAWVEALRRMPLPQRGELYQNMLEHAFPAHPELHTALWAMASPDAGLRMVYFGWATPEEFKVDIAQVLEEDPDLRNFSPEQLRRLFAIWLNKGDTQRIESLMATRPEWLKAGYRALAEADAARGDYIKAVDLMKRYLPAPQFPRVSLPHEEAARRFTEDPGDVAAGITVYNEAMAAGRDVEALATLRAMATNADCPGYVHYLEGQLLATQGKPEEAWKEFDQCPDAGGR